MFKYLFCLLTLLAVSLFPCYPPSSGVNAQVTSGQPKVIQVPHFTPAKMPVSLSSASLDFTDKLPKLQFTLHNPNQIPVEELYLYLQVADSSTKSAKAIIVKVSSDTLVKATGNRYEVSIATPLSTGSKISVVLFDLTKASPKNRSNGSGSNFIIVDPLVVYTTELYQVLDLIDGSYVEVTETQQQQQEPPPSFCTKWYDKITRNTDGTGPCGKGRVKNFHCSETTQEFSFECDFSAVVTEN